LLLLWRLSVVRRSWIGDGGSADRELGIPVRRQLGLLLLLLLLWRLSVVRRSWIGVGKVCGPQM